MPLIERLQREVKRQSDRVRQSLPDKYDDQAAEIRDLLEEVLASIKPPLMVMPADVDLSGLDLSPGQGYIVRCPNR